MFLGQCVTHKATDVNFHVKNLKAANIHYSSGKVNSFAIYEVQVIYYFTL